MASERAATTLGIDARWTDVPTGMLVAATERPVDGMTWMRWGAKLGEDTIVRLESELRQAIALGETVDDVSDRLETVQGIAETSAERLARTALNDVGNRARLETYRENSDVIRALRFTATLDSRTSLICAGLDGQEFDLDDADLPTPPLHPNCRSVLVPVTASFGDLGIDVDEVSESTRASERGQVSADLTYAGWLRRQPAEFQRDVLGPVRYHAWKNGLPLDAMATQDRPLTIDELRRLYPQQAGASA
jgi:SPP1 gp7 family putative phage head morphogenesis protein